MTASRRSRRHPPLSAPEERLRTLGLDSSPTARRLRARIPRAPSEPGPGAAVPRAPYAVGEATAPYRPEPRRPTPAELWGSPGTAGRDRRADHEEREEPESPALEEPDPEEVPTVRLLPGGGPARSEPESPPPQSPWKEPPRTRTGRDGRADPPSPAPSQGGSGLSGPGGKGSPAERGSDSGPGHGSGSGTGRGSESGTGHGSADPPDLAAGPGSDPPAGKEPEGPSGGRHRRRSEAVRPPSGYTELDPGEPGSVLDRVAERWGPRASLSRRAVAALLVLGLLAVAGTFLVLRERPSEVTVPELVSQAAPAGQEPSGPAGGPAADGPGPEDEGAGADAPGGDVVVHVGGEVAEPGLYTMPAGSRVADAVEEAGGPLPEADLDLVNLARTLTDGERILVGVPQPEGGPGDGPAGSGAPVDLNLAGQAELETLPGIGPKKAQQILAHREALNGSFSSVEDLLGVDGIAEKTFRTLEPLVTVG
ncbi:helix-hairpin-helix domain-containing protein [Nocardiopsis ganjiahuensis]|uniref:helix-hairpin-helix domain-containing protein n=1 Tax=Nocardiopsis ganjiahuensis TaxID=239984 RepID=UPI00037C84CB|nr:helix-hairpin-helix domain-containing protein [Nocardiopsis ganjiahuensis]